MEQGEAEVLAWRPKSLVSSLLSLAVGLFEGGEVTLSTPAPAPAPASASKAWARALAAGGAMEGGRWGTVEALAERLGMGERLGGLKRLGVAGGECMRDINEAESWALDAPEEFIDPLLSVLMLDPVRAGPSGRVYDRDAILQQILTDPRDPFSREPLRAEDLIPLPDLQGRVLAWMKERREREGGEDRGGEGAQ